MTNIYDEYDDHPLPGMSAKPETPAAQQSPAEGPWRNIARNVAAGAIEGGAGLINMATDPFGTVIGPTIARVGGTAYDAGAHLTGLYPPMKPETRAFLYGQNPDGGDDQLGTRLVNTIDQNIPGPKLADVQANTVPEQIARKAAAGVTAGGSTAGVGGALVGAGGAVTGDVAGRGAAAAGMDWLAPGAELAGNYVGGKVAQKVVSPINAPTNPERERLVEVLDQEGIPLTAGERTGNKRLVKTEQMMSQLPGSGGGMASDAAKQQAAINRSVARRAGLDTDTLTTEVVNDHMYKVLGPEIDRVVTNNTMQISPAFQQTVKDVRTSLVGMKAAGAAEIKDLLNQFDNKIQTDPVTGAKTMPGKFYQSLMSDFGDAITSAKGSIRGDLIKVRDGIRTQMESSMLPQDAALLRELNRKYANAALIQGVMGSAGAKAAEGDVSLLQLRQGINRSMGSDAYGKGQGDLNDLARAGQSVLRQPTDSQTPAGTWINKLLTGAGIGGAGAGAYFLGGTPEAAMAGAAVPVLAPWAIGTAIRGRIPGTDFSPGQSYLSNRVASGLSPASLAAAIQAANEERRRHPLMMNYRD
jgi:hypothetical protein